MEQNKYKGFVSLPQQFMVLTTIMITAYTEAMQLCKSRWWWCIKNHPPDPYPPKKGKVRRQDKKPKRKQNPLTTSLGLYAAGIITSQIPVFHFASAGTVGMRKHFYKYSDTKGFLNTTKLDPGGSDMDLSQRIIAEQPQGLLTEDDSTMLVINCGVTSTMT